jgi:putative peptidoglycan lipid II flippase
VLVVATARFYLPLIASGYNPQKLALTLQLVYMVSPVIVMSGLSNIWGAVLNAGERFALVALTPIITPTVTLFVLLFVIRHSVFALPVGLVVGATLETVVLGVALKLRGISLRPRWHGLDSDLRLVGSQFGPRVGATMLRSGSAVVDRSMAAMLAPGSVATLSYGARIMSTLLSLAGVSLGAAVTPYYSKIVAQKDWEGLRRTLRHSALILLVGSIPAVLLLYFFAQPLVQLVFERGSFRPRDTQMVAQVHALYALQIPFYLGSILLSRLMACLYKGQIMFWAAGINLVLSFVLNVVFINQIGVAGIALSTSCASLVTLVFLSYHAIRLLREKQADVGERGLVISPGNRIDPPQPSN